MNEMARTADSGSFFFSLFSAVCRDTVYAGVSQITNRFGKFHPQSSRGVRRLEKSSTYILYRDNALQDPLYATPYCTSRHGTNHRTDAIS